MSDMETKRKAVFLDRDGTINVEKDFLYRIEDFDFIPGAPEAIRRLKDAGYLVIVVTNQSGVARGYFGLAEVETLHVHIQGELRKIGTSIDAFYICPHHPTDGVGELGRLCDCRKGRPGMLLQAEAEHGIDLSLSFMVGDKVADVEAGQNAGCSSLMVRSGYGASEAQKLSSGQVPVFDDIVRAVDFILKLGSSSLGDDSRLAR